MAFCKQCGRQHEEDAVFCPGCGNSVGSVQPNAPAASIPVVPAQPAAVPAVAAPMQAGQPKNWIVAVLLSFFLGAMGIDRFYLGYIGAGVGKLLTAGGFGIWALIDFILILIKKLNPKNGYWEGAAPTGTAVPATAPGQASAAGVPAAAPAPAAKSPKTGPSFGKKVKMALTPVGLAIAAGAKKAQTGIAAFIKEQKEKTKLVCPACGISNSPEANQCSACNASLEGVEPVPVPLKENAKGYWDKIPKAVRFAVVGVLGLIVLFCVFNGIGKSVTNPEKIVANYFEAVAAGDSEKVFAYLGLEKSEFVNKETYAIYNEKRGMAKIDLANYEIDERRDSYNTPAMTKTYIVTYYERGTSRSKTETVTLVEDGKKKMLFFKSYSIAMDNLIATNVTISAFKDAEVTLDGIALKNPKPDDDGYYENMITYTIDRMFTGEHDIVAKLPLCEDYKDTVTIDAEDDEEYFTIWNMELSDAAQKDLQNNLFAYTQNYIRGAIEGKPFAELKGIDLTADQIAISNMDSVYSALSAQLRAAYASVSFSGENENPNRKSDIDDDMALNISTVYPCDFIPKGAQATEAPTAAENQIAPAAEPTSAEDQTTMPADSTSAMAETQPVASGSNAIAKQIEVDAAFQYLSGKLLLSRIDVSVEDSENVVAEPEQPEDVSAEPDGDEEAQAAEAVAASAASYEGTYVSTAVPNMRSSLIVRNGVLKSITEGTGILAGQLPPNETELGTYTIEDNKLLLFGAEVGTFDGNQLSYMGQVYTKQ